MDEIFRQRGLSDIKIGSVGLERLRKMAENQQLVQSYAPMLPLLMPFLDTFNNQEYLVQRIKELAQGSCIGDYRWNSGNAHNGQEWGDHLPTDAAVSLADLFYFVKCYSYFYTLLCSYSSICFAFTWTVNLCHCPKAADVHFTPDMC